MNNQELLEKLLNKTIEMYFIAEKDRDIYGNSYVEFKERGMKIINPNDLIIKINTTKKQIKLFKKKLKKNKKNDI